MIVKKGIKGHVQNTSDSFVSTTRQCLSVILKQVGAGVKGSHFNRSSKSVLHVVLHICPLCPALPSLVMKVSGADLCSYFILTGNS